MAELAQNFERRLEVQDRPSNGLPVSEQPKIGVIATAVDEDFVVDRAPRSVVYVDADREEAEVALARLSLVAAGFGCRSSSLTASTALDGDDEIEEDTFY